MLRAARRRARKQRQAEGSPGQAVMCPRGEVLSVSEEHCPSPVNLNSVLMAQYWEIKGQLVRLKT